MDVKIGGEGGQVANSAMLDKVRVLMASYGEQDAVAAIDRWLNGDASKVPGKTALQAQAKSLEKIEANLRSTGQLREAAYVDLARFCVTACV